MRVRNVRKHHRPHNNMSDALADTVDMIWL